MSKKFPAALCVLLALFAIGSAHATPVEGHYMGVSTDGAHSVSFSLHAGAIHNFHVDGRNIAARTSLVANRHFSSTTEQWHVNGAWHTAHEVKGTYFKINHKGKAPIHVQWEATL